MRRDDGSMAVAMSGVTVIVAVLAVAVASIGMLFAARAQATNAADAAALAAAVATYPAAFDRQPLDAARQAAVLNGAVVVDCRCPVDTSLVSRTVEVVTAVSVKVPIFGQLTVESSSRAEFDPVRWFGR